MINRDFIERKCKLIGEDLARLKPLADKQVDEVAKNDAEMALVERYLERLITRALDINQHIIAELGEGTEKVRGYEDTFYALVKYGVYDEEFAKQIAPSAGLRNRLVHEYNDTDSRIIFQSVGDALLQYTRYGEAVLNFAESLDDGGGVD